MQFSRIHFWIFCAAVLAFVTMPVKAEQRFEAESATRNGVSITASSPASGGYRTAGFGESGDSITFTNIPAATYLKIHYSLEVAAHPLDYPENVIRQCGVYVNGVRVETVTFDPSSSWDKGWQETVVPINTTGSSTIKLQVDSADATFNKGSSADVCSVDYIEALNYITLPIQLRAFRHEDAQFDYTTSFNRNVPQFDNFNRAYIRARNIDLNTIPGYVQVLQNDGTWAQKDFFAAIRAAYPEFTQTEDGGGEGFEEVVVFDADNDAYQIVRIDRTGKTSKTLLLYSNDGLNTWKVYELPDKEYRMERPTNPNRLTSPPALISMRGNGANTLNLTVITKSGGSLALSALKPYTVTNTLGENSHSGGTHHAVTVGNNIHLVWSEDVAGSAPIKTRTYNKLTDTFSTTVTLGAAQPPQDEHVKPSMVVDSQGYLHVVSGSHQNNSAFYVKSTSPNSTASWTAPVDIITDGYDGLPNMAYMCFYCDDEDTLHLIYRNGRMNDGTDACTIFGAPDSQHKYLVHQRKKAGQSWDKASRKVTRLVAPVFSAYACYKQKLGMDKNGRMYLSYAFQSNNTDDGIKNYPDPDDGSLLYKYSAMLVSDNHGDTWRLATTADFLRSLNNVAIPSAPAGVIATPGNKSATIGWSGGASGYNVYRSFDSKGHFKQIAGGLTGNSYVDNYITNGTRYFYVVTAVDGAGLESRRSDEISALPSVGSGGTPSVSLTAPTNTASFTAPASIAMTADASDADGTITTVGFYNGSTLLGSDANSPYAYTWTNVTAGSYNLTAWATDNSGAVSTSAVVAITVLDPVYTLMANGATGGAVSPASTNVLAGNSASFVITASNYYRIATLKTNSADVTGMLFDNNSTTTNFIWDNVQTSGVLAATFTAQVTTNAPADVPYEWLAGYGLTNYNTDATNDVDLDGLIVWQEYIAGTDPTNGASCFTAAQNIRDTIIWNAVSGRVYSVYWATNLMSGFQCLESNIPWTRTSFTNAITVPCGYYKIDVRLAD